MLVVMAEDEQQLTWENAPSRAITSCILQAVQQHTRTSAAIKMESKSQYMYCRPRFSTLVSIA